MRPVCFLVCLMLEQRRVKKMLCNYMYMLRLSVRLRFVLEQGLQEWLDASDMLLRHCGWQGLRCVLH